MTERVGPLTFTFPVVVDPWVLPEGYSPPEHLEGWRPVACRSCGALILFATTRAGKQAPLNQDGTSHFASCSDPDKWRRR